MSQDAYFQTRFAADARRELLWKTLCEAHFSKLFATTHCVLELGAGYGAFINNVAARRRIAVDAWPGFRDFHDPGVEGHVGDVTELAFLQPGSVDFAFASNLFEHVTQDQFASVLAQLRTALSAGGTLNILQPNYRFAFREYFDDDTHRTVYSHVSL